MKGARFILQLMLAVALLVVSNGIVAYMARNVPAKKVIERIQADPGSVLAHGNSTMAVAFLPERFAEKAGGGRAVKSALGATLPVDHLALAKFALEQKPPPKTIIYGFYSFQLFEPPTNSWRQFSGNRAVTLLLDPAIAARYSGEKSVVYQIMIHLAARIPALRERELIWAKVEKNRRWLSEIGLPKAAVNQFGRVADFQKLAPTSARDIEELSARHIAGDSEFSAPIEEMFTLAQKEGVEVIVVAMPATPVSLSSEQSRARWREFIAFVARNLAARNIRLIDASFWTFKPEFFADSFHVTREGAEIFTDRLAVELAKR